MAHLRDSHRVIRTWMQPSELPLLICTKRGHYSQSKALSFKARCVPTKPRRHALNRLARHMHPDAYVPLAGKQRVQRPPRVHGELLCGPLAAGCGAGARGQGASSLAGCPGPPGPAGSQPIEPGPAAEELDPWFAWAGLGFDDPG